MASSREFYTSTPGGSRDDEEFGTSVGDDSFFTPLPWYAHGCKRSSLSFSPFIFLFIYLSIYFYLYHLFAPSPRTCVHPPRWKKYKRALIIGVSVLGVVLVGLIITAAVVSSRHDSSKHTATGPKSVVRVPTGGCRRFCVVAPLLYTSAVACFTCTLEHVWWSDAPRLRRPSQIVMITDGFGPASVTLARTLNGAPLQLDRMIRGTIRTKSADSLVTDSAAGATSYSCGLKTNNTCAALLLCVCVCVCCGVCVCVCSAFISLSCAQLCGR